jgi:hypothetical protein
MILTDEGRAWAERNQLGSMVARVALIGYGSHWPITSVDLAIKACNTLAEKWAPIAEHFEPIPDDPNWDIHRGITPEPDAPDADWAEEDA